MNELNKKIIAFLISIVVFPIVGILIERLLHIVKIIDDYGYIGTPDLNWFYHLFFYTDGYMMRLIYFFISLILSSLLFQSKK